MKVSRLRALCVEIYKTLNDLNQNFIKNLFELRQSDRRVQTEIQTTKKYKLNLTNPKWNKVSFGYKSLRVQDAKIWNSLPYHIKPSEKLESFNFLINN